VYACVYALTEERATYKAKTLTVTLWDTMNRQNWNPNMTGSLLGITEDFTSRPT